MSQATVLSVLPSTTVSSSTANFGAFDANTIPPEFAALHDALYKEITGIVGGQPFNSSSTPRMLEIILASAMTIVETVRKTDGTAYSGPVKQQIALALVTWVISDLTKNGIIPQDIAQEVNTCIRILGPTAINLTIAAANGLYALGQKAETAIVNALPTDAATGKKKCCGCLW